MLPGAWGAEAAAPAAVHALRLEAEVVIVHHVGHVLLPHHHQLDRLARLLDDVDGVIHVPRRLVVDGDDLVILLDAVFLGLAAGHDSRHEDAGLLLLELVEAAVDEREAEAAGAAVHLDHPRSHG